MSPEQAAGHLDQLDTRSDVYTLGVILFHLLTGKFPHGDSGRALDVMKRISEDEPLRLRQADPRADGELQALLSKALAREPDRRYASAGELADDLVRFLNGEPLIAQPPTLVYLFRKKLSRHRMELAIATIMLLALTAMGVWSYARVLRERDVSRAATI